VDVGTKAAASNNVWYPREAAYSIVERGFLLLEMLDAPVSANKLGARSRALGRLRKRIFLEDVNMTPSVNKPDAHGPSL